MTASLLRDGLGDETGFMDRRNEVAERWAIWREEKKRREADTSDVGLGSAAIFAALNRHVPENAIIAVDVGNNTYSFGRYFEWVRLFWNGGFGMSHSGKGSSYLTRLHPIAAVPLAWKLSRHQG